MQVLTRARGGCVVHRCQNKNPIERLTSGCEWRHAPEARARRILGILKKSVSWVEFYLGRRRLAFACSLRPDEFARYGRRTRWGVGVGQMNPRLGRTHTLRSWDCGDRPYRAYCHTCDVTAIDVGAGKMSGRRADVFVFFFARNCFFPNQMCKNPNSDPFVRNLLYSAGQKLVGILAREMFFSEEKLWFGFFI